MNEQRWWIEHKEALKFAGLGFVVTASVFLINLIFVSTL